MDLVREIKEWAKHYGLGIDYALFHDGLMFRAWDNKEVPAKANDYCHAYNPDAVMHMSYDGIMWSVMNIYSHSDARNTLCRILKKYNLVLELVDQSHAQFLKKGE